MMNIFRNLTAIKVIIMSFLIFITLGCGQNDSNKHIKTTSDLAPLPILRVGSHWTIKQARESSTILAALPRGFDEWQSAYLNVPVKFILVDKDVEITIDKTHTFLIAPKNGDIEAINIVVAPLFPEDLEGALAEVKKWMDYFTNLKLAVGVDSALYYLYEFSFEAGTKRFKQSYIKDSPRYGTSFGIWQTELAFYVVTLNQIYRTVIDKVTGQPTQQIVYKVGINSWSREHDARYGKQIY